MGPKKSQLNHKCNLKTKYKLIHTNLYLMYNNFCDMV